MTIIMIFGKHGLNGGLWGGLALYALCHTLAQAQSLGVSSQGNTGGLVIPSAQVLPVGTVAASYGNYQEPFFGPHEKQQNMSLGIGLLPYVEFYGRFANYCDNCDGFFTWTGIRDISASLKLQIPTPWVGGPKLALGMNELGGGAQNFGSKYVVASEQFGPLDVSLGYAKGRPGSAGFDGAFGGVAWRFGNTGVSALAEYDGQQKHAGLRWNSEPILAFGNAQVVGSVQQSFSAPASLGPNANTRNYALTLLIPLTDQDTRAAALKPESTQALPDLDAKPDLTGMQATAEDRLASLRKALIAVGLERVRVGLRESSFGSLLM
ncbi:MAG: YjbH domain-containing protein, partial [Candidatus Methylumidiphilus sp.]